MDPRIEALKSTTFFGRRFTRRQIADIAETVAMLPNDSRNELSKTICEHLGWTTPKGEYRVSACLRVLERLEECGILTLPEKRGTAAKQPPGPIVHVRASDPQPEIACGLAALEPLALEEAASPEDAALWKALVDRCHYLGCPRPFGPHIRWFVRDRSGRPLAVLLFEAAARELPARDEWIGWSEADRGRRLHLAVSNSRFLVLPWVRVDNLASKALALALRGLAERWEAKPRLPPGPLRDLHRPDPLRRRLLQGRQLGDDRHDGRKAQRARRQAGQGDSGPAAGPGVPRGPEGGDDTRAAAETPLSRRL